MHEVRRQGCQHQPFDSITHITLPLISSTNPSHLRQFRAADVGRLRTPPRRNAPTPIDKEGYCRHSDPLISDGVRQMDARPADRRLSVRGSSNQTA
jgi:hypothetical protein